MNTQIHELSHTDLDDVSGGLRNFPIEPVQSSAPILPPPVIIPIPILPPTHGPFSAPGPGILER